MDLIVEPGRALKGEIQVPGDKSISHRAIMCASLASGVSTISGFLESEDCLATLKAFQSLGINIDRNRSLIKVQGKGLYGLKKPDKSLDLGNSGTSMRLITGILAGQKFNSVLSGDESLLKRPMERITNPLNSMGYSIKAQEDGTPPLEIFNVQKVSSINYELPIASAQVKSCLMFASLFVEGESVIKENFRTRDHTERMFLKFAIPIHISKLESAKLISITPPKDIKPCDINVCGDFSSASFFILAALISPNSHVLIRNVGINSTRTGFLVALREMGANITIKNPKNSFEPVADIEVKTSKLKGVTLDPKLVPNIIDELPSLFIASALAEGTTKIRGAKELRYKESDRLESMAQSLDKFGVTSKLVEDGIDIKGLDQSDLDKNPFDSGEIDSFGDHRVAMASIMGALRSKGTCKIKNCENISTSFPGFIELSNQLGLDVKKE